MQRTLARTVHMTGIGVHQGEQATIRILSAPSGYGIRFLRTDVVGVDQVVEARYDAVIDTALCTRIGNADGVSVSTIEHLMAAFAGCGIDNALVELDGPEIPIMDGSAQVIGVQHRDDRFTGKCFIKKYADSRTFGRLEDIEKLRSLGFARGGSLDNAVVVNGAEVLNEGGS